MGKGLESLSERERETLRLLLRGHDAKSAARDLGLSVHTVNERLRDARRKLDVSSSREAARLLGEAERDGPNSHVDKQLGVARTGAARDLERDQPPRTGRSVVWLIGGIGIMLSIVAAIVLSSALQGDSAAPQGPSGHSNAAPAATVQSAGASSAREWVALVDGRRWQDSWTAAGTLFKSQITAADWSSTIRGVREPLGAVSSRTLRSATPSTTLPGLPTGEYEVVQFQTSFAGMNSAVETVVLAREESGWKVIGYFIR